MLLKDWKKAGANVELNRVDVPWDTKPVFVVASWESGKTERTAKTTHTSYCEALDRFNEIVGRIAPDDSLVRSAAELQAWRDRR